MRAAASRWPRVVVAVLAMAAGVRAQGPDLSVRPIARDGQLLVSFELNDAFRPMCATRFKVGCRRRSRMTSSCGADLSFLDWTVASMTVEAASGLTI